MIPVIIEEEEDEEEKEMLPIRPSILEDADWLSAMSNQASLSHKY